jgi:hypothetical protein
MEDISLVTVVLMLPLAGMILMMIFARGDQQYRWRTAHIVDHVRRVAAAGPDFDTGSQVCRWSRIMDFGQRLLDPLLCGRGRPQYLAGAADHLHYAALDSGVIQSY